MKKRSRTEKREIGKKMEDRRAKIDSFMQDRRDRQINDL